MDDPTGKRSNLIPDARVEQKLDHLTRLVTALVAALQDTKTIDRESFEARLRAIDL